MWILFQTRAKYLPLWATKIHVSKLLEMQKCEELSYPHSLVISATITSPRQISMIALEKRAWRRAERQDDRLFSGYVTAVKASDASMKCSTHAEATAPSELRQMFTNSFHSGWYVVATRIAPRNKSARILARLRYIERSFRENASVTFRRHKCERSDACEVRTEFQERDYFENFFFECQDIPKMIFSTITVFSKCDFRGIFRRYFPDALSAVLTGDAVAQTLLFSGSRFYSESARIVFWVNNGTISPTVFSRVRAASANSQKRACVCRLIKRRSKTI